MVLKVGKLVSVKTKEETSVEKIVEMIITGKDLRAVDPFGNSISTGQ
jgi:hypothetical protein